MRETPLQNSNSPLRDLNEGDFAQWKHHPVTKVLHQYLRDYHDAVKRAGWDYVTISRTANTPPMSVEYLSEAAGRAKVALEIADLDYNIIVAFYQPEEENGTQTAQDYAS